MEPVREVALGCRLVDRFQLLEPEVTDELKRVAAIARGRLAERTVWHVSSNATSGGVPEMLHSLLPYVQGLGIRARWLILDGTPAFLRITRRLHNALHGNAGDGSALGRAQKQTYEQNSRRTMTELNRFVRPGDVVVLHDPQTAGLVNGLIEAGMTVVWRCHVGTETRCPESDRAWEFLRPMVERADALIFSKFSYVPASWDATKAVVIPPSIDGLSPKNHEMDSRTGRAILRFIGLSAGPRISAAPHFELFDGHRVLVRRRARIVREGAPPTKMPRYVVQVSQWDRLKDPSGVLDGFCRAIEDGLPEDVRLLLVGPSVGASSNDQDASEVFEEVLSRWRDQPESRRRRIDLVTLPTQDREENAVMVNAIQSHATVVVQKSLCEGFGLTVTEAMWKAKPVLASAVGGIQDQIIHGVNGMLIADPSDSASFATTLRQMFANRALSAELGRLAQEAVRSRYLGFRSLMDFGHLIGRLRLRDRAPELRAVS